MTLLLNPAWERAIVDHCALAQVDYTSILAVPRPDDLRPMNAVLSGQMYRSPSLFVPYFIAMDVLNYQFWDLDKKGQLVRYGHNNQVGALAMQTAFQQAWEAALPLACGSDDMARSMQAASVLRERIAAEGVAFLFGDIPSAESRRTLLIEVLNPSELLQASELVLTACQGSELTFKQALELASRFPLAYGDDYLKKAQLTLMFIAGQWNETQPTHLSLDVTAAADYQLPKVLRALGLLVYAPELAKKVDGLIPLQANGKEERAIRAATILACEALARQFSCGLAEVDSWLWTMRNQARDARFHLTYTTAY